MLLPQEIIRKKRAGAALSAAEIAFVVDGIVDGSISDAQLAALAMATCIKGMGTQETVDLTLAMRDSGAVLRWDELDLRGPVLDKHSTGGVGDLVSLVLAPLVAACGGVVPMISGRGLGHTGGTQDKLDAIPGYCSTPDLATFRRVVQQCGCAIIGQTADLAPADKRLYAIRDLTATVDSSALITASILAKKLAAGLSVLVMDIKTGNGAVTPGLAAARELAASIVLTAAGAGIACAALLTDMSQPLAPCAGNATEVRAAMQYLRGDACPARLHQTVLALGTEMLMLGGLAQSALDAQLRLLDALHSGRAAEAFGRMCAALGGPADFVERYDAYLPPARLLRPVYAAGAEQGYVHAIDTRALGLAVLQLGGGRSHAGATPDYRVGLSRIAEVGQLLDSATPLALVHASDEAALEQASAALRAAFHCSASAPAKPPQILECLRAPDQFNNQHRPDEAA
ncbi:MAG: thymidine phosphorylase [Burkholderiales bacterium]|nr:thymidine phosphorylase [Burkholderiales bacterium]